jgi:phosphatidylglycerol:prolipoprotein diacylglycerol transferase
MPIAARTVARHSARSATRGSVIPYFTLPSLHLGPLTIEPFGILAAIGIWTAAVLMARAARKQGLPDEPLRDFATWGVVGGLLGGHFVHLFLYHPEELTQKGWLQILRVWDGQSSFGGLMGGILAAAYYFRHKGIPFSRYADALALGVAPGWGVARLGCFVVHDHPGQLTNFPLAVMFPGGARHDLGLYDAIALFAITALLYSVRDLPPLKGKLLGLLALLYGVQRFLTDFLRASDTPYHDARYFGLTPAQYGCVALVIYGLYVLTRAAASAPAVAKAKR